MATIDPELVERAIRWCAEAGRQTTAAATRAALSPLGWDELLAVRALLADPPPARPLGPLALADIARGAPADVAAERERAGRYRERGEGSPPEPPPAPAAGRARGAGRKRTPPAFRVKRAADRAPAAPPTPRPQPLLDELLLEEGRAVLGRLLRAHGGRRSRIVEALAAGWRRPDGQPVGSPDLDRLLAHHGLARAFENRERDEVLHALRAAGSVRSEAAAALGLDAGALESAIDRLGAHTDAERLREERRRELRARGTLTQRTHQVLDDEARLVDLALRDEFVAELRERLPDHVRALASASLEPIADLLGKSLALDRDGVERLARLTGLRLQPPAPGARAPRGGDRPRGAPSARPGRPGDRRPPGRPAPDRPSRGGARPPKRR